MKCDHVAIDLDVDDHCVVLNTTVVPGKFMMILGHAHVLINPEQAREISTGLQQMLQDTYPDHYPDSADHPDPEDVMREDQEPF